MSTMLGAVYIKGQSNLTLQQIEKPVPGPKDVLLRVRACGVCHSDVTLLKSQRFEHSFALGHEICGEAVEIGAEVPKDIAEIGGLYSVNVAAAKDPNNPGVMGHQLDNVPGLGVNGGYAEFVVMPAVSLVKVPEGVSVAKAAVAADAGVTAYHAVYQTGKITSGDKVLVIGAGGVGMLVTQLARLAGAAEVIVTDLRPEILKLATSLGATRTLLPEELDAAMTAGDLDVDVVFDVVSSQITVDTAFRALLPATKKPGGYGRLVIVGVGQGKIEKMAFELIVAPVHILPSFYGSKDDLAAVLKLIAEGKIEVNVEEASLEQVNEVLDELRAGTVRSRKVVIPSTST